MPANYNCKFNMAAYSSVLYTNIYGNVLSFLLVFLRFQCTVQTEGDPLDVLLTSYKNSREVLAENRKFNHHRHVRDCQPIIYGNTTFETFSVRKKAENKKSAVVFESFFQKVEKDSGHDYVNGHIVTISDPLKSLSILEPQKPGGCKNKLRSTVAATSKQMNCRLAVNAGFFNTHKGSCLGNIVSNGKLVRDAKGIQNANFGILKDGTLVAGYLSEHDVTPGNGSSEFYQLITGVIWILRNGSLYVDESIKAECRDTEETGTLKEFANVLSGRTAVGYDKNGQVVIVQVDGKTGHKGMNLYDFGKFLQSHGLVNAINLDGGGSATFIENGTVVNYPSDQCDGYLCARKVSTILCVHDKMCNPPDCNEHGECSSNGQCVCHDPWFGQTCAKKQFKENSYDGSNLCNTSIARNCSTSFRNETTREVIKRFLIKNYAWMDALLVISVLINFILLFVTFCGGSSGRSVVPRKPTKSRRNREDEMDLLYSRNNDDEI